MHDEHSQDELVLTPLPDGAVARRRQKPATLVDAGGRLVTSDGRFHAQLAAQYLVDHARTKWVPVSELAKVFCGGNNKDSKQRVRKNMFSVFAHVLNHGHFLLYETVGRGRIEAVKLLDGKSVAELNASRPQLERMRKKHQISADKYDKALSVIELREAV